MTTTNEKTIDSFMKTEINRELLRYAVSRQMFCDCGQCLDTNKNAVYFEYTMLNGNKKPFTVCIKCFQETLKAAKNCNANDCITDIIYCTNYDKEIKKSERKKMAAEKRNRETIELKNAKTLDNIKYSIKYFGTNRSKFWHIYTDGHLLIDFSIVPTKKSFKTLMKRRLKENYFQFHQVSEKSLADVFQAAKEKCDTMAVFCRLNYIEDSGQLEALYAGNGVTIRFNAYLLKIFEHFFGDFTLYVQSDTLAACVVIGNKIVGLIMPLRPIK